MCLTTACWKIKRAFDAFTMAALETAGHAHKVYWRIHSKAWQRPRDKTEAADIADLNTRSDCQGHIYGVQGRRKQAKYPSCYDAAQVSVLRGIDDARQASGEVEDEAHNVVVQIEESANEE